VAVWALKVGTLLSRATELHILNPRIDIGHRQRSQRGLFTRLNHPAHLDIESYLDTLQLEEPPLRKYVIPGRDVARALTELGLMNITFATMYPDLLGAALQTNFETVSFALLVFSSAFSDATE
jgi:hypothetical protein